MLQSLGFRGGWGTAWVVFLACCSEAPAHNAMNDAAVRDAGATDMDARAAMGDAGTAVPEAGVDTGQGADAAAGPAIGDPCIHDGDCGDEGKCLDYPGGYCSRLSCDTVGCPDGSQCAYLVQDTGSSLYACARSCVSSANCRTGYECRTNLCFPARPDAGMRDAGSSECSRSSDCPVGRACDVALGQCVTTCNFDQRCNGGCCGGGQCREGTELSACGGARDYRCADCTDGCSVGAACTASGIGGYCECSSCTPVGASCTTADECCSRFCGGVGGDRRCQI